MKPSSKQLASVKSTLDDYEFPVFQWVYCRPTIADLYKDRCGIYVFRSRNEEYYVGQAIDVVRRYLEHKIVHDDIQEITFKPSPIKKLDAIEREVIAALEANNVKLRNINHTSLPKGDTDLELIIPKKEQEEWLMTNKSFNLQEHFIDNPVLQEKYNKRFNKLIARTDFNESAYPFLKQYFAKCLLQPAKTELSFWALTCLTKAFSNSSLVSLSRLNIYWCEVLTIWVDTDKIVNYSIHLTKSILSESYLRSLKIKSLEINSHFYKTGGPDQFNIEVKGIGDALKLLNDEKVVSAIKTFNLRLMQKGPTVFNRYHCIDLARFILNNVERFPESNIKESLVTRKGYNYKV